MYDSVVVHYSEIGTKGENRGFFEGKLIENIKKSLGKNVKKVYRRYGRIICDIKKSDNIREILINTPGIAYFSFAIKTKLKLDDIKKSSLKVLKKEKFKTFKAVTKRSNKNFNKTSQEINETIGEHIIKKLKKRVDVKNPEMKVFIEVGEKEVFVYNEKINGIGGLPVGVSGTVISSLSGGIDSPVASYMLMKRGCKVVFVHIHNRTQMSKAVSSKLEDIVKHLTKFQLNSKLYIIPFEKIQQEIINNINSKYRMIIYRRFMMKIINEISKEEMAKGIVTGDSIGQVASQTLENLNSIQDSSSLPIFSPLIGMNKEEIIQLSKKIGTYEYSIMPYPDCCSFMIAKHPKTKSNLNEIKEMENNIQNQEKLIKDAISRSKIKDFS